MGRRILLDVEDQTDSTSLCRLGYVIAHYGVRVVGPTRRGVTDLSVRIYRLSIPDGMKTRVLDWLNPIAHRKVPHV